METRYISKEDQLRLMNARYHYQKAQAISGNLEAGHHYREAIDELGWLTSLSLKDRLFLSELYYSLGTCQFNLNQLTHAAHSFELGLMEMQRSHEMGYPFE